MLLTVNLLSPSDVDESAMHGLRYLDRQVVRKMSDGSMNTTGPVPLEVREHVGVWLQSATGGSGEQQVVRYLDLNHRVFCNEFSPDGQSCEAPDSEAMSWSDRGTLATIDADWAVYGDRRDYLEVLLEPSYDETSRFSEEEYNDMTRSVAIIYVGESVQANALQLIWTTLVVIVIIILGIVLITKDLAFLHTMLTRPLGTLSLEMQSIKHLQLAGLDDRPDDDSRTTAEIQIIQRKFDGMKTAIKSWGKYVPWPVVQLLLALLPTA